MSQPPRIAIVNVCSALDATSAPALRKHVEKFVHEGCRRVVINLQDVDYLDSTGIATLLALTRLLRSKGGLLSLSNASPVVYRALRRRCLADFIPTSCAGKVRPLPPLPPFARPQFSASLSVCPANMAEAREKIRTMLSSMSFPPDEAFDMLLACGEAISNAVDHAQAECVSVSVECYADRVVARITDDGQGFEVEGEEIPPSETGDVCRGRGIRLMRMLADFVSISKRHDRSGTEVTLIKLI